jgi:hypothetical protein
MIEVVKAVIAIEKQTELPTSLYQFTEKVVSVPLKIGNSVSTPKLKFTNIMMTTMLTNVRNAIYQVLLNNFSGSD